MNAVCVMMPFTGVMRITGTLEISQDWFKVLRITSGIIRR